MRRRRAHRRSRPLWILLAVVLLAMAAAFVAGTIWFDSYLRSRQLLELITVLTGNAFRSDAHIEPLRWSGSSAFSEQVTLIGRDGSAVRNASANQVRAELNWRAAFNGVWRVDEITMAQFEGDFAAPEKTAAPNARNVPRPTGLASLLPHRFELGQAKVGAANLSFGPARASAVRMLVTPDGVGWRFDGNGGTLKTPFLPLLDITSFRARVQGGDFFLTESALRLGESGRITATGESCSGGLLRASWDGVRSSDVLDAKARRYIEGRLSGSVDVRPPGVARGRFQFREGFVENVPMLGLVADFTGNPAFRRMPLQEMSSEFSLQKDLLVLTNFVGESRGLLRVEGNGQITGGEHISGRFQIGVTPQTLQWLPGSRERVFTVVRNGYLWTDIVVGGTLQNPTEDLSARLRAAMGAEIIEQGTKLLKDPTKAVDGAKELLNKDPVKAIDGAKGLLNNFIGPMIP